jgi:LAO/AO transport system kinase
MTSETDALADAVVNGDRGALARAITLVESTLAHHRREAVELIDRVMAVTGGAVRVGISGPPGVGKSSLIEALGIHLVQSDQDIAVLAVDPSSPRSGGSILGDKTRMDLLGRSDRAFIRPSPAGTTAGGVARRTRESMLLCEAAGFDVVLVETVGAGQSDVAVADLVDVFVVLVQPSSGDELQGIKRGVMELADVVVVTKADGDLADAARHSVADHRAALSLLHHDDAPAVLACSTVDGGSRVERVWDAIISVHRERAGAGILAERRRNQARKWLWAEVESTLLERLRANDAVRRLTPEIEEAVGSASLAPGAGAIRLLDAFATR